MWFENKWHLILRNILNKNFSKALKINKIETTRTENQNLFVFDFSVAVLIFSIFNYIVWDFLFYDFIFSNIFNLTSSKSMWIFGKWLLFIQEECLKDANKEAFAELINHCRGYNIPSLNFNNFF